MSRTCKCGGQISTRPAKDGRELWHCKSCGRGETMYPSAARAYLAVMAERPVAEKLKTVILKGWIYVVDKGLPTEHYFHSAVTGFKTNAAIERIMPFDFEVQIPGTTRETQ